MEKEIDWNAVEHMYVAPGEALLLLCWFVGLVTNIYSCFFLDLTCVKIGVMVVLCVRGNKMHAWERCSMSVFTNRKG